MEANDAPREWKQRLAKLEESVERRIFAFDLRLLIVKCKRAAQGMD